MVFCELFEQNIRVAHAAWMFFFRPPLPSLFNLNPPTYIGISPIPHLKLWLTPSPQRMATKKGAELVANPQYDMLYHQWAKNTLVNSNHRIN